MAAPMNGPQLSPNPVKAEVEDDIELDTKNMANAPFVNKVWKIVNDPANHKYIRWVQGGRSIQIVDREGFEKQLLPFYFKHKRFTSFVRQLNMYGWHKVQDLSAGTMQSSEEHWQFANPNFLQNRPELLRNIVRNKGHRPNGSESTNSASGASGAGSHPSGGGASNGPSIATPSPDGDEKSHDLKAILRELEQIKMRQIHIGEDLGRVRKDNELLWTEYYQTRERYDKHSQMLSRILRFLATVYGNQSKILDLNNPNSPAGAAAERVLRGPVDIHHPAYLGLLPSNDRISPADTFREIEQMQHQIEEANTPSSNASNASNTPTPPAAAAGSGGSKRPSTDYMALVPSRRSSAIIVPPPPPSQPQQQPQQQTQSQKPLHEQQQHQQQHQTRQSGQTSSQPNQHTLAPPAATPPPPLSSLSYPNNQLIRAVNQRFSSPLLSADLPNDNYDDPDKLFPELADLSQAPNMPPLSTQELEQISREVASNGTSLQNIQEWLNKQSVDSNYSNEDDQFNVDDFLSTEEANGEKTGEPETKRVRVG